MYKKNKLSSAVHAVSSDDAVSIGTVGGGGFASNLISK